MILWCSREYFRRWLGAAAAAATLSSLAPARAETSAGDKAAAEALFEQGVGLMKDGRLADGCSKLEQSLAIERAIGTSLYLAECYEKTGRTASAWGLFREAASQAQAEGQGERAQVARERADRLAPSLSKLTLTVAAENRMEGFTVQRNGSPVSPALWGAAIPVDPGSQKIEARAPGYAPWAIVVEVPKTATSSSVAIPVLGPEKTPSGATPLTPAAPPSAPEASSGGAGDVSAEQGSSGGTQRTIGLVAGGVGIVAVGVGSYFGIRALSKNSDAEELCPGDGGKRCDDPQGVTLTEEANDAAMLANVFVIGGAVLAAGGVVLYLTAPKDDTPTVGVMTDGRGARLTVGGAF